MISDMTASQNGLLRSHLGTSMPPGGGYSIRAARAPKDIQLGDVVAVLEADQALVECLASDTNTCTLTPHCRLKARLAHAEAAFVTDINRSALADCAYRPEGA